MKLFPKIQTPYYIWSPPYTHESSGVRILHLLCHALNESGQRAYLLQMPDMAVNPHLNTPIISTEQYNFYRNCKIDPIVVYPDVVQGNPMGARKVVRYLLADAGKYGGDKEFPKENKIYGYTTSIARNAGSDFVLCLPCFDTNIFNITKFDVREGSCFYSHKYDILHGNKLLNITRDSTRLVGTPEQIAEILRKSEVCYVYEVSEVAINAELCGCPVVFVRTDYFNSIPKDWDYVYYSQRWSDDESIEIPFDIARAQRTQLLEKHLTFERQLKSFIQETQSWKI